MVGEGGDPSAWVDEADGWAGMDEVRRQRGEQGFSKADWINFDTYIAWVIHNAVVKMKVDGNTAFYYSDAHEDEWEALTHAEYDVMIKGFGQWVNHGDLDLMDIPTEEYKKRFRQYEDDLDAALTIFKKRFKSLWD